jgi:hypothetical protein
MPPQLSAIKAAPAPAPAPTPVLPGSYLTDETNLFRCVSAEMTGDPEGTALLEDCLTLEPRVVPLRGLDSGLRVVRPRDADRPRRAAEPVLVGAGT